MALALPHVLALTLPDWIDDVAGRTRVYPGDADKVMLTIALAERNVAEGSGGPFGAAIFGADDRLLAVGVNRVLPQTCSVAHAEMMAFMLAQQATSRARLNIAADGMPCGPVTLATSAQPCCQCYGATFWAGIDRLLIGARSEDVMRLTEFDEGPLPLDWAGELEARGIHVLRDIEREAACRVLADYAGHGGAMY